jgi:hypothetical protein
MHAKKKNPDVLRTKKFPKVLQALGLMPLSEDVDDMIAALDEEGNIQWPNFLSESCAA